MKSKPVIFGIRLYVSTDWKHAYVKSLSDNGSGNRTTVPRSMYFCGQFRSMRTVLENKLDNSVISKESPSALWKMQNSLQTKLYRFGKGRMVVTDFYTRHTLASQLLKLTDGEMTMLGTVR